MGTNYYYEEPVSEPCPTCGHADDTPRLHIGKSSSGWVFALHTIPERGLNTLEDWKALWASGSGQIRDEYGEHVTVEDMLDEILNRSHPNGLRRGPYAVDGHARRGGDTYDYVAGDFS